jgi:hypothetical protein
MNEEILKISRACGLAPDFLRVAGRSQDNKSGYDPEEDLAIIFAALYG